MIGLPQAEQAAKANGAAGGRAMLVCLADVPPEPISWLWPGRLARGKLNLIIGEPGTGKSTLMTDVGARITRGAAWPDGLGGVEGPVLWLTAEDGLADTVRPRVDRQGGDPARIFVLQAVQVAGVETPFLIERDLPRLEEALLSTGAVAVGIDPLSSYLGSRDSYKDAEIRGILAPLAGLAERLRVAVVGILHLTKDAQRRLLHRAQGSIAFVAAARTVLAVGEDPEDAGRRLFVGVKSNLGLLPPALAFRIDERGLHWESGPVEGSADRLLAADLPGTRSERREREEALAFLRRVLAGVAIASAIGDDPELGLGPPGRTEDGKAAAWYWMLPAQEAP